MPTESWVSWEILLTPVHPECDPDQQRVSQAIAGLAPLVRQRFSRSVDPPRASRGYIVDAAWNQKDADRLAMTFFSDPVTDLSRARPVAELDLAATTATILRKPGVMDPVSDHAKEALRALDQPAEAVRTFHRLDFTDGTPADVIRFISSKLFANEAIDQIILGNIPVSSLSAGSSAPFTEAVRVPLRGATDDELLQLSKKNQLYLDQHEMNAIREHFRSLDRDPTDVELETIAQTWSEHCSHKTLRGPYRFNGTLHESGILKETIFHATRVLKKDWCVSVFVDNAGIIKFDDQWNVSFKVETHNHPSAIEPYGGSNTGIGGVVRDILGAGLGGKPICNTNVFCVAPPHTHDEDLPPGTLHPARVLQGVVAGVRDYGNRMGIPTVNGAVFFDPRYLGNPLVFAGTVGLMPADQCFGQAAAGDLIVAMGGRTGRDGIHGATFSSGELTEESEVVSSGAVQIGNAIMEKKVQDVLLQARDRGLFRAVTDCGAGGFSSAVGEMGEELGAEVDLETAPLKYDGLSYREIWISEAQERMVLAVSPTKWDELKQLADSEGVEVVAIGRFGAGNPSRLILRYRGKEVGNLSMEFLHQGRPATVRVAEAPPRPVEAYEPGVSASVGEVLKRILGSLNVCSKEWIIRQYDHEVLGGSVVKPLVGVQDDGPSDAAVLRPLLHSNKGLAVACGMNPRLGDLDPFKMAMSAIDEAIRNVVAVGGDPDRIAILDNFCWGRTERPEELGKLVEAARGCMEAALGYETPFISGKDSLNNEFVFAGNKIVIPPSLLISAIAIIPDVRQAVTMDLKRAGNGILLVGLTRNEVGGSHLALVTGGAKGAPPVVDTKQGRAIFLALHRAIREGLIRSCHDLSEGGMAVALAEMSFAGGLGAFVELDSIPTEGSLDDMMKLFAESNSRFLLEVEPDQTTYLLEIFEGLPIAVVGSVTDEPFVQIRSAGIDLARESIDELRDVWKKPLAW
ncbi:phosphoribosylformylglycinamidine synthase subunit PurL [bacterium]|nr:phosphoribosylformylglycinamidine synthase subunit PurL [bacterium]